MWPVEDGILFLVFVAIVFWWYSYISFVIRHTDGLATRIFTIFMPLLLVGDSMWPSGTGSERIKLVIGFVVTGTVVWIADKLFL